MPFQKSPLTLRSRMTLLIASAVAVAIAVCAFACWFIVRGQLYEQLDKTLTRGMQMSSEEAASYVAACQTKASSGGSSYPGHGPPFGGYAQIVLATGERCLISTVPQGEATASVKVTASDMAVAEGKETDSLHNSTVDGGAGKGTDVRVFTTAINGPIARYKGQLITGAVSVARPLTEVENSLNNLALLLVVVAAAGVLGASSAGLLIARASLRPVNRLTEAVEHVAETEDLTIRIPVEGKDEIARLSTSFNAMTSALASSQERQQRLIADAGHELRTPLTSLRTNVDLLLRSDETGRAIPPDDRRRLLHSLQAQMGELSGLIGDLLELSRPDSSKDAGRVEVVPLHEVVTAAVQRARLRAEPMGLEVVEDVQPWYVVGHAAALERAVVNLLDNAVKFSPAGGRVEVRLGGGGLTVRDHGPGIPAGDLPHVFERFWRSPSARSMPGSGLGLSIVARAVEGAGGRVSLAPAAGGGTVARVDLPGAPVPPPS
ncbi:two-component sensor histidine kinase [Mangrovactinospora gilvigrisea]|uniref:histidine kinase n=1 Tax=Mangrovactinospora gilvigrisea TaxID=1428644 RepID=A0A1J7CDS6_9ACTN|nr:HAMP domain-containing sensor histidine kinase [Mangrovactinospora gilvigrisea]OIV37818.1 two-component sensor histidine kinase [Mangrovactinospora gilvigrisea]